MGSNYLLKHLRGIRRSIKKKAFVKVIQTKHQAGGPTLGGSECCILSLKVMEMQSVLYLSGGTKPLTGSGFIFVSAFPFIAIHNCLL